MAKLRKANFRRINLDLWRAFKTACAKHGIKIYVAQEEALKMWLKSKGEL